MRSSNPFLRLFGQSPFKPLQEHMRVVVLCANQVPSLFEALCADDREKLASIRDEIDRLESEADDIKNQLRSHLPRSMFLPVDRGDLLEILDLQDSIADTAEDIAGLLVVRPAPPIEILREPLLTLVGRCVAACDHLARIMEQMDELLETGFGGREAEDVMAMIDELNAIEGETDRLAMVFVQGLFTHEAESDPVSVVLWFRLTHWIGDLANYAEKVGNRLRLLIAR